ncbi:uncharacterized protein LOC122040475 [Zingiber officinale]|uniref:uncharacterized protein LOC122040475 n=1 Tax=Zingiber officinale TaxID=94328 RepID=UPI001C4BDB38|nr:uncharacterized protein LOC122040475 [Zingiber officinale]
MMCYKHVMLPDVLMLNSPKWQIKIEHVREVFYYYIELVEASWTWRISMLCDLIKEASQAMDSWRLKLPSTAFWVLRSFTSSVRIEMNQNVRKSLGAPKSFWGIPIHLSHINEVRK